MMSFYLELTNHHHFMRKKTHSYIFGTYKNGYLGKFSYIKKSGIRWTEEKYRKTIILCCLTKLLFYKEKKTKIWQTAIFVGIREWMIQGINVILYK